MGDSERDRWVAEAAYYIAERRAFEGESALDDWLEAERRWQHSVSPFPDALPNEGPDALDADAEGSGGQGEDGGGPDEAARR